MSSGPVPLGRVFGSLAGEHLSVELAAEASVPTTTRRADGAGFSQQHLLASAAGCAGMGPWRACFLADVGEVRMAGRDIDHPAAAAAAIVQAGARLGVVQHLGGHFFVDAHADGLANLTRWRATLDQVSVWVAPPISAVVGIDVGIRFH